MGKISGFNICYNNYSLELCYFYMEVWENMKKILIILSLLILSACSSREVYQSLDTRAGFEVVDGKIVPSMSSDCEKQINFMEINKWKIKKMLNGRI